jgi:hypothetical protein
MAYDMPACDQANNAGQIIRMSVSKNGTVQKQPKLDFQFTDERRPTHCLAKPLRPWSFVLRRPA